MQSISLTPLKFDASLIRQTIPDTSLMPEFEFWHQLSVTHSKTDTGWFSSVGSLYNFQTQQFDRRTEDFTIMNQHFAGTYLETVINQVNAQAAEDQVSIGRIRFMFLRPKTCYTLHQDLEEFRYHIPLITNNKCFFVNADIVERMPIVGRLYRFKTRDMHTAVNASNDMRIHLVFDTY